VPNASVLTKYGEVKAWYPSMKETLAARRLFKEKFVEVHPKCTLGRSERAWYNTVRSARLKASPTHITNTEFDELCRAVGYRCTYCGKMKPLTKDHLVGVSDGGSDDSCNIVPACQGCNTNKWYYGADFMKYSRKDRREAARTRIWMCGHPEEVGRIAARNGIRI